MELNIDEAILHYKRMVYQKYGEKAVATIKETIDNKPIGVVYEEVLSRSFTILETIDILAEYQSYLRDNKINTILE